MGNNEEARGAEERFSRARNSGCWAEGSWSICSTVEQSLLLCLPLPDRSASQQAEADAHWSLQL